jgi:hypothetical protein
LEELNEATLSVLCNGETVLLQLIHNELVVSNTIGEVPADIPKPPLQVDIEKLQKSLRLPPAADFRDYTLDLRKETDLQRSVFLHRLRLLGIRWGEQHGVSGKGTFKEQWRLQWDPSFSIDIIEKGSWGNTVEEATNAFVIHEAQETESLLKVAGLLKEALPAELRKAVTLLVQQINNLAAASGDVLQLMEAVPPLVQTTRYGNVRKTDSELVLHIVSSMITRICIGLPNAVTGINEEAAQNLVTLISHLQDAISLLQEESLTTHWQQTLRIIADSKSSAPVIAGFATRLLTDYKLLEGETLIKVFSVHMSCANAPDTTAAWLEGFLKGSGTILLLDANLWNLVNGWVASLEAQIFTQVLPLLRRTFANFSPPERRKLGEKVKGGIAVSANTSWSEQELDIERAKRGIPVVLQLLGYLPSNNN